MDKTMGIGSLAPQAKSLLTTPPLLPNVYLERQHTFFGMCNKIEQKLNVINLSFQL